MGMQLYSWKQDGSVHSKQTRTNQHNFRVAWNCNLYSEWLSSMSPSSPLYLRASIYPRVSPWPCKACRVFLFSCVYTNSIRGARANFLCPRAFSTISVVLLKFRARSGFRGWKHNDPRLKSIVLGGHFSGFLRKIARNAIRRRFDSHKRTNERTNAKEQRDVEKCRVSIFTRSRERN